MKIYKITEASKYLGISINSLKTLANNGKLNSFKTSGDTKYDALVQYLDEQAELLDTHTENETKAHKPNTCTCPCHNI